MLLEQFLQQLWLGQCDRSVVVVADVDAKKRVGLGIERQLIVVVHPDYELVDILLTLAEYESIVDE